MKKIIAIILTITLCLPLSYATANTVNDIWLRVGLKSMYEKVPSITIKNTTINLGYALDNNFISETSFESSSGFVLSPAIGYYYVSNESFNSYEEANQIVQIIKQQGIPAYTATVSNMLWKIYIGGQTDKNQVNTLLPSVDGKNGVTYHLAEDNQQRVTMIGDFGAVILENSFIHPQIEPVYDGKGLTYINLGTRQYRGRIEIGRYKKEGLTAINVVPLEEYLYGVVPSEVSPSWPIESLKAQAVTARTYALYSRDIAKKYVNEAYDLCDTTASQVYKGYTVENNATNQAVDVTRGKMIYYNNTLIPTFFFSTSGGSTENSENVWSNPLPYLKAVPDIYESKPAKQPWIASLTSADIENNLAKYGIKIGKINDLVPEVYSDSGRVMSLKIIGSLGTHTLTKEAIRTHLGLNSRKFKIVKLGTPISDSFAVIDNQGNQKIKKASELYCVTADGTVTTVSNKTDQIIVYGNTNVENYPLVTTSLPDTFLFAGQGYGHGVGMSQSGARGMAESGFSYVEILEYYYSGAKVR